MRDCRAGDPHRRGVYPAHSRIGNGPGRSPWPALDRTALPAEDGRGHAPDRHGAGANGANQTLAPGHPDPIAQRRLPQPDHRPAARGTSAVAAGQPAAPGCAAPVGSQRVVRQPCPAGSRTPVAAHPPGATGTPRGLEPCPARRTAGGRPGRSVYPAAGRTGQPACRTGVPVPGFACHHR